MRIFVSILLIIICFSCNSALSDKGNNDKNKSYLLDSFKNYIELDSITKTGKFSEFKLNYFINSNSIKLTLVFDDKRTIQLDYPLFDITGSHVGYAKVFFNEHHKPFAIVNETLDNREKELTLFNVVTGVFYKSSIDDNQEFNVNSFIEFEDYNYQCEIIKNVDNLMHRFSSLGRYSPTKCLNRKADLKVIVDSVELYKFANIDSSKILDFMNSGTYLKYLISDSTTATIDGVDHYFLKVENTVVKQKGWILYNPENIIEVDELDIKK